MTHEEVKEFLKIYDLTLFSMSSNKESGEDTSKYTLNFIDDTGINITVNPNTEAFQFGFIVDNMYQLKSGEFTKLSSPLHFDKNYLRFKKSVFKILGKVDSEEKRYVLTYDFYIVTINLERKEKQTKQEIFDSFAELLTFYKKKKEALAYGFINCCDNFHVYTCHLQEQDITKMDKLL